MSKRLVLMSTHPDDVVFTQEVAKTAELEFVQVSSYREGAKLIAEGNVAAIFADIPNKVHYADMEKSIADTVGLFSDLVNANAFHFLSSLELSDIRYLIESPIFGHYVLRNYGDPRVAGKHYGRIVKATLAERAFGLAPLLASNAKVQQIKLHQSAQKQDAVEAVKNYLLAAKFQSRMATVIANAVDELMMNAIFDAPSDELGRQTLAQTPRDTAFKLEGQNSVEMHVGYDGNYVAITAIDHFGSIDKNKLLRHISKIYTVEEYKVKSQVAGAGIGLATVFKSGGSFFFVSESQVRTEVTVFFKRTDSFREFKDQFRFISTQFYF